MYGGGGRGRGGPRGGGGRGRGGPRGGGGGGGGGGGNRRYSEPERKLFVGGLDRNTAEEGLKTYFGLFGEIQEVNLSKNPETGQSRGFAFLTFQQKESIDQIQSQRPHTIDGRQVGTLRVLPKDPTGATDTMMQVKKLFVGGIKGPIEETDLRETFSQFGKVVSVSIPTDKASGRQKGFVFIEFDDCDCVDNAFLNKNKIQVKGNNVDVKKAFEKEQAGGRGGGRGGRGGRGAGGRGGSSGYGGRGGYEEESYGGYDDGYGGYEGGYDAGGYGAGSYDGGYGGYSSTGGYGREEGYESARASRGGGYSARGGYSSPAPAARGGYGKPQGYGKPAESAGRGSKGGYGGGYGGGYESGGYGGGYESKGGYGEEYEGEGGYWEQGEGYGASNGYGGHGGRGGRGAARGSRGRGGGGAIRTPRGRARPQPYSNGGGY